MIRPNKPKCFVIMPFSKTRAHKTEEYWTEHYEEFIVPQVKFAIPGIVVERAKVERGAILNGIVTNLIMADIVIADLTDSNPNVYWELGIRHSFSHGTVLIAESRSRVPFDIAPIGIHRYSGVKLHERKFINSEPIVKALRGCINNKELSDSHVLEIIKGRGSIWYLFERKRTQDTLVFLIAELGTLILALESIKKRLNNAEVNQETSYLLNQLLLYYILERIYVEHLIDDFDFHTNIHRLILILNRVNRLIDIAPLLGVKPIDVLPLVESALELCQKLTGQAKKIYSSSSLSF